jgi:RimJ/RimL family protein N-acetyltransferase
MSAPTTNSTNSYEPFYVDCGKWLVRTATVDDASERWASWLTDPQASHFLNAPPKAMKLADLVAYIKSFDQKSRLLLGIFEQATNTLVGFIRFDIDLAQGRYLGSILIGEPEYRNKGVVFDITEPCRVYLFEKRGMKTMVSTALSHNRAIIYYMLKTGWKLDKTIKGHVKSQADGSMLDLCYFSITREAWRAWRNADAPGRKRWREGPSIASPARSDS